MTDADARLKALLSADEPPPRDPAFVAAVLGRAERRRLTRDVAAYGALALAGSAVAWALWPSLAPIVARLGAELTPVAAVIAVAVSGWTLLESRTRA